MSEQPLWVPTPARIEASAMQRFMRRVAATHRIDVSSYAALYDWSVRELEAFWSALWDFCEVGASVRGDRVLVDGERMPGARWFPDARLNYAENLLRHCRPGDGHDALVFRGEQGERRCMSRGELHDAVARFAAALRAEGVVAGDRVVGYIPNLPEAIVAMLASASLGAIWSSASPDFGVQGVVDRFGQIAPKVMICADGYYYGGKRIDVRARVAAIGGAIPSLDRIVVVDYQGAGRDLDGIPRAVPYEDLLSTHAGAGLAFEQVPFAQPLFILYSSGTTGVPKCIVHGHGGTLLQHLKEHVLHSDVRDGDRLFYFTTCGWMMWNWLASALAVGATLLLFDGAPLAHDGRVLLDYLQAEGCTQFGTSAKYLDALAKLGFSPRAEYSFTPLRAVLSTGSPLSPEGFEFVYREIKTDVCLSSISGGTDIVSCFALGNPILPVWSGELQCRGLGMAVEVYDESGRPLRGQKGELVCTRPFPSMPIGFWGDHDGARYRAAYFERFPNIWCHGDFCELTAHDGLIIHGRSDTVLNPGGVRIGTAEIYRQVETIPEVQESIVIGQDWDSDVRVVLFVRLRDGVLLDEALASRIQQVIRNNTTPRHVPAKILQVSDIPRTRSGKIVELAVRQVVHGREVTNTEALANPEALAQFRSRPELCS